MLWSTDSDTEFSEDDNDGHQVYINFHSVKVNSAVFLSAITESKLCFFPFLFFLHVIK